MEEVIELYKNFSEEVSNILLWNFYSIYSILIVFNLFDFYLFHKDYLTELIDIFENSEQV